MAITSGIVGAGATIGGGLIGASAASKAAKQQAQAARDALAFEQQIYGTGQQNLQPWISTGQNALGALAQFFGLPGGAGGTPSGGNALQSYQAFTQTPFYTFPLSQGEQAIQQATAASGLNLTPGTIAGLGKYATGYASQNFNQYISNLASLAGSGQTAATALAQFGTGQAQLASNVLGNLGTAQASGTMGGANALQNALSGIPALLRAGGDTTGSSYAGGQPGTSQGAFAGSPLMAYLFGGGGGTAGSGGTAYTPGGSAPFA